MSGVPAVWTASLITLWIVVLGMAFLLAGALRQLGLLRLRMGDDPGALITDEGLARGSLAPPFDALVADTGDRFTFTATADRVRVLVLLSIGCLACRQLAPHINEVAKTHPEVEIVPLVTGDLDSARQFIRAAGVKGRVLVDVSATVPALYGTSMSPFTYVIDEKSRVLARGVANDWRGLESLINEEGMLQAGRPFVTDDSAAADTQPSGITEPQRI